MIQCKVCKKKPRELEEYKTYAKDFELTPEKYVIKHEGTYNPKTQEFYCTECYIKIGQPLGIAHETYEDWIKSYKKLRKYVDESKFNEIKQYIENGLDFMQIVFPELKRANGTATPKNGISNMFYTWFETPKGKKLDPIGLYEIDLTTCTSMTEKELDTYRGKCINCGKMIFSKDEDASTCSESCENEYMDYLNQGL